jgi:hypothetical protein
MDRKTARILASCTVEALEDEPCRLWDVTTWGLPPFDVTRHYTIEAQTDDNAAKEGLRRFEEEMENLRDVPLED